MPGQTPSLLEQLELAGCLVDVDSFDPAVAASLPFKPHDATSNQALIRLQVFDPELHHIVQSTTKSMPGASPHDVLTVLHAKFGKRQSAHISGRVLAQTSPSFPHDKAKIIGHARAYAKAFNAEGLTNDRFCIKIPTTTAGVQAAAVLRQEGIASLGTALFSLPQAIAASQAGMYAISPYFNRTPQAPAAGRHLTGVTACIAHSDASYWADVQDPVTQHPMSSRMVHISQTYKTLAKETGRPQPQIKGAACLTAREVMAQYELGCDHVTVLPPSLKDLVSTSRLPPYSKAEHDHRLSSRLDEPNLIWADWTMPESKASGERLARLAKADPLGPKMQADAELASTDVDYLADGVLDECNAKDAATKWMLENAIAVFREAEQELFEYIAKIQQES